MRARKDALDGLLSSLRLERKAPWRDTTFASSAMTDQAFEDHVAELCEVAQATRASNAHDGARTAERIKQRLATREAEWTRRTALDLQRLADLDGRMRIRQAEGARRRWFVLGRLMTEAAQTDCRWQDVLRLLLQTRPLTGNEAKALGLSPTKS